MAAFYRVGTAYVGAFDGAPPPEGAVEVNEPPARADATWNGSGWDVPVLVPVSVTKLQLRNACIETEHAGTNWWVLAKAALAAGDAGTLEEWDLASVIDRDNATFTAFATALGATSADIDAVFILAATK